MSIKENKTIVRRWVEGWNTASPTAIDELFITNFIDHTPSLGESSGLEGFKQRATMIRTAFPDLYFTVEDMIAEGDRVLVRWIVRGTHEGVFMGIPATGRQVTWEGINIFRITGEKIIERWTFQDQLSMLQQLGMSLAPKQA